MQSIQARISGPLLAIAALFVLGSCSSGPELKPVSVNNQWEFFRTKENASVLLVRKKAQVGQFFYQIASQDPEFLGRYLIWSKGKRPQPLGRQRQFEKQVDLACLKNRSLPAQPEDNKSSFEIGTEELVNTDSLIELINHYFPQAKQDEENLTYLFKNPGVIGATLSTIRYRSNKVPEVVAAFVDCRDPQGMRFALAQARSYVTDSTISLAQYIKHVIRYKHLRGDQIGDRMTDNERDTLHSSSIRFLVRGIRSYASNQDRYARWLRSKKAANSLQRYAIVENQNAYILYKDLTRLNGERSDELVRSMEFRYNRKRTENPKMMPRLSSRNRLRNRDLKTIAHITQGRHEK